MSEIILHKQAFLPINLLVPARERADAGKHRPAIEPASICFTGYDYASKSDVTEIDWCCVGVWPG